MNLAIGIVLLATAPAVGQGPVDLIPEDAAAAVAVRNLDELRKKGDKLVADAQVNLPLRPSELFQFAFNFLGVQRGLDPKGSAAIVLMNRDDPAKEWIFPDIDRLLVPVLPVGDRAMMATNFDPEAGKLEVGKIHPGNKQQFSKHVYAAEKHVYLSSSEATLKRLAAGRKLGAVLTAEQKRTFDTADLLVQCGGAKAWGREWDSLLRDFGKSFEPAGDPAEQEAARKLAEGFRETRFALAGVTLDGGLGMNFLAVVPKDGVAAKALREIRGAAGASHLKGLPEGRVLAAQAHAGEGKRSALYARLLFDALLKFALLDQGIVSPTDRHTFAGVFQEVWQRLRGSRLAVYQNADEPRLGLFSAVAILDAQDAGKFLSEMKTLARIADGTALDLSRKDDKDEVDVAQLIRDLGADDYPTRSGANTRLGLLGEPALPFINKALAPGRTDLETKRRLERLRDQINAVAAERRKGLLAKDVTQYLRPTFVFVPGAESRAGTAVDVVQIKLQGDQKLAGKSLRQLLGPDWDKLRLAVAGNQVAVLLGSDTELFDTAVKNLKESRPGLAGSKLLESFNKRSSPDRQVEFHVSAAAVLALTSPKVAAPDEPALTSFALGLGADHLRMDLFVPIPDVRVIAKAAGVN